MDNDVTVERFLEYVKEQAEFGLAGDDVERSIAVTEIDQALIELRKRLVGRNDTIPLRHGMTIKVKLLSDTARMPLRASKHAAGLDLYADENVDLLPGRIVCVKTGIALEIPLGYEGQIRPRSGLASGGITVANAPGTIDADYRGQISVLLHNVSELPFRVSVNMRIAQLVIAPVVFGIAARVETLTDTERGAAGFGSTGNG